MTLVTETTAKETPVLPELTIAQILTNRRHELDLTHAQIAEHMGIRSPEFIGLVERGKRNFELNRIPALAEVLRFERADLVKVQLANDAPLAYDALFGGPPRLKAAKGPLPREEAQEVLDKLYQLDDAGREEVLALLRSKFARKVK